MSNLLKLPPVWMLIAILATFVLHYTFPLVIFNFRAIDTGLIAAGVYLIVAPIIWFKRKKTTILPRQKPSKLIVEGLFKFSRNPMYLGMVVLTFGIGVTLGSLQALIPAIALFFHLQKNFVIPEERKLREALGQDAEDYFATTGRWIWFL